MKKKHAIIILYIVMILFMMLSNICFSNASQSTTTTAAPTTTSAPTGTTTSTGTASSRTTTSTTTTAVKSLNSMYDVLQPGQNPLAASTRIVLGIIRWVGVAILIGAIMIKGIKYVTASPDGKADIKKDMIMLFIGALLLFGFTKLIDIIYTLVVNSDINSIS